MTFNPPFNPFPGPDSEAKLEAATEAGVDLDDPEAVAKFNADYEMANEPEPEPEPDETDTKKGGKR